jgi:hypothetical protein
VKRTWVVRAAIIVLVAAAGFWLFFPREYRAAVQSYALTDDPRVIVLHASLGPGDSLVGSEVREDGHTITVIVKARDVSNVTVGSGDSYFVTVRLNEPIDDRTVIDGTDLPGLAGQVVPRVP